MIDISRISANLEPSDSGVWFSRSTRKVSYTKDGNIVCFGVEGPSFWYQHRNGCIAAVIKRNPAAGAIFDIGGGNGVVSAALQEMGMEVYLVEPGLEGVLNAKKRGLKNVICSTLEDSGFKENTLPSVGIFDVLEHTEDDIAVLKMIKGALVGGGKLFISVPAYNFLWSKNDEHVGHFRRYTLRELRKKLERCGFNVEYATYFFTFLPFLIFLLRTLPTKLGIYGRITPEVAHDEHRIKNRPLKAVLNYLMQRELTHLREGKRLKFGSSCLVVAAKPGQTRIEEDFRR